MFYLLLFVLLLLAELLYFRIADKFNIIDKPNQRSSHTRITLRGGGIVFYLGSVAYFISCGFPYGWFLLGLTLIAGISFADDIHSVPNRYRLLCQFSAMLLMFYQWGLLTAYPWWYILIAWIVCTGIINAYNFMDGINGITGGYSLAVLSALAYINHFVVPFIEQEYLLIHILAVLVFCIFNFRTKAKCFAGDVGSVSIAFVILFAFYSQDIAVNRNFLGIPHGGLFSINESSRLEGEFPVILYFPDISKVVILIVDGMM